MHLSGVIQSEGSSGEDDNEFFDPFSFVVDAAEQEKFTTMRDDVNIDSTLHSPIDQDDRSSGIGNEEELNGVVIFSSSTPQKVATEEYVTPLVTAEPPQDDPSFEVVQLIKEKEMEKELKGLKYFGNVNDGATENDDNVEQAVLNLEDSGSEKTVTPQLLAVDYGDYSVENEDIEVLLGPLRQQLEGETLKEEVDETRHDLATDTAVSELKKNDDKDNRLDLKGVTDETVPGNDVITDNDTATLNSALDGTSAKSEKAKRKAEKARIKEEKARLKEEKAVAKAAKKRAKEERVREKEEKAKEKERKRLQQELDSQRLQVIEDEKESVETHIITPVEDSPPQVVTDKEVDVQDEVTIIASTTDSHADTHFSSSDGDVQLQPLNEYVEKIQEPIEESFIPQDEDIAQLQSNKESNGHLEEKVEKMSVSSRISKFNFPPQTTSPEKAKGPARSGAPRRLSEQQLSPFLRSNTVAPTPNDTPREVAKLVPRSHSVEMSSPKTSHSPLTPSKLPATRLMPFLGSNSPDKMPTNSKHNRIASTSEGGSQSFNVTATVTEDDVAREGSYTKLKGTSSSPSPPGPVRHEHWAPYGTISKWKVSFQCKMI